MFKGHISKLAGKQQNSVVTTRNSFYLLEESEEEEVPLKNTKNIDDKSKLKVKKSRNRGYNPATASGNHDDIPNTINPTKINPTKTNTTIIPNNDKTIDELKEICDNSAPKNNINNNNLNNNNFQNNGRDKFGGNSDYNGNGGNGGNDNAGWTSTSSHKKPQQPRNFHTPSDRFEHKNNYNQMSLYDPSTKLKGHDMHLNSTWKVWIHENDNPNWDIGSYINIYTMDTIDKMWRFLNTFDALNKTQQQYYIMREGIMPIWEDNNNKHGGICSIMIDNVNKYEKFPKSMIGIDSFVAFCVLVMNESFVQNNLDINGINYSVKNKNILIKLWVKDYQKNIAFINNLPKVLLQKIDGLLSLNNQRTHRNDRFQNDRFQNDRFPNNKKDNISVKFDDIINKK